jgi:hypothetical protein
VVSKEQKLTLLGALVTISVTGIGLAIGGTLGATVIAGLGINLSSNIIHGGCSTLKDRWLYSGNGIVNHDIQKMLGRAFIKALIFLENSYLDSKSREELRRYERRSIQNLFAEFRENVQKALPDTVGTIKINIEVKHFLFSVPTDVNTEQMWQRMVPDDLIKSYGSEFGDFMRRELLGQMLFWFGEELKTDNKECNKGWRAFQRLLLEGIYAGVQAVQADQTLILQDLRKLDSLKDELERLRETIDNRLPNEPFQEALRSALDSVQRSMREIAADSKQIFQYVEIIHRDVQHLIANQFEQKSQTAPEVQAARLTEIRQKMLMAVSDYDLKEVYYDAEAFVADNPQNPRAVQLRDQIEEALFQHPRSVIARTTVAGTRWRFTLPQLASMAVILAAISGMLTLYIIHNSENNQIRHAGLVPASRSLGNRLSQQQQVIAYWNERVESRKDHWSPQMRSTFDRNMNVIDMAVNDSLRELSTNPHDEISEDVLNAALNDKIALLQEYAEW